MVKVKIPLSGIIFRSIFLGMRSLSQGYLKVEYSADGIEVRVIGDEKDLQTLIEEVIGLIEDKVGEDLSYDSQVSRNVASSVNNTLGKFFRMKLGEKPTNLSLMKNIIDKSKDQYQSMHRLIENSLQKGCKIIRTRSGVTKEIIFGDEKQAAYIPDMIKQAEFQEYPERYLRLSIRGGGTCKILMDPAWYLFFAIGALMAYSGYKGQEYHFIFPESLETVNIRDYINIPMLESRDFIRLESEELYELQLSWRYAQTSFKPPREDFILYSIGKRGNAYILKRTIPLRMTPLIEFFRKILRSDERKKIRKRMFDLLFDEASRELAPRSQDKAVLVFLKELYHGVKSKSVEVVMQSWAKFLRRAGAIARESGKRDASTRRYISILRSLDEELIKGIINALCNPCLLEEKENEQ